MTVIVHHAVESTKALVDARKHHLTVEIKGEPLLVSGDPVRLTQKSSSGLGIGLSLVFQLVALHGGTIKASSKGPSEGSTFVLRFLWWMS